MANFNKTILAGYLTRDPEMRYLPSGTALAEFTLGVNETWTTEQGEKKEKAHFFDFVAFGKQAETIQQYLKKGSNLLVEGKLSQETWEDKETQQKRSRVKVKVEAFQFLDKAEHGSAPAPARQQSQRPPPSQRPTPRPDDDMPPQEHDDVPF